MRLHQVQVTDYIGKLSEQLTKKQADTIEAIAKLFDSSQKANLGKTLETAFPGKDKKEALNSLRVLRNQVKAAAKSCSIEFEFCVDSEKRKQPDQRNCWFEGTDLSSEKMEQMQKDLLSKNPEYLVKDFTPPLARSRFRIFVSSSDNRDAEIPTDKERTELEDFLRSLRHTLKAMGRADLADGIYHFREHQDNLMFKRIETALDGCEIGLLLISKPYLASAYVKSEELPRFNPIEFHAGKPGVKDSVPLLFSPCFDNDPVQINNILGLSEDGGLQILRHREKLAFSECDERSREQFIENIAERLSKKLPPFRDPAETPVKRHDYLDIFTIRQRDKLNADSGYNPTEWERTRGECCNMGRAGTAVKQTSELAEEQPRGFDALDRLSVWARDTNSAHVHALLGDLGSGKTFTCRMLALHLLKERMGGDNSIPLPIYIDLREVGFASDWQSAPTLDHIMEGWLKHWQLGVNPKEEHGLDVAAVKRLSQAGALWIFDGFDEISTHLSRNGDTAFFKELLRPVVPEKGKPSKSKVLISCRSHYFPTVAKQNATLLEEARGVLRPGMSKTDSDENPELICDSTLLLPFDENQIKSYLSRTLGETEAVRAMEVIAGIHDLTELSRQPYLLRLIREQIAHLEIMKSLGKPVNTASLYGLFVADWLQRDEGKHTIEPEDKLRLMERLAAQMWSDRQRGWTYEQLHRWALAEMEREPDWRFRYQQHAELIAKDLHTAAFIVRYGESSFRFIHTSMQEYFVAAHLLRGLHEQRFYHWDIAKVSAETISFLADLWQLRPLHEHPPLFQAQRHLHAAPPSPDAALLALDYLLIARHKGWLHALPDTLDLSGTDIGQRILNGHPSQPWTINLLRMNTTNAPQLLMSHLIIKRLEAQQTRLVGSSWQYCTVEAAYLEQVDMGGAQIRHCNWQAVSLVQTSLRYAEIRCSRFDLNVTEKATEIIGPVWWLNQAPAPAWAISNILSSSLPLHLSRARHNGGVTSVAWRGDGLRLATAGDDMALQIWDSASCYCLNVLRGHTAEINSVIWSRDGKQLATASSDRTVRIWDVASGSCLLVLQGHEKKVKEVTWRMDGKQLASVGVDNSMRIWDAGNGECLMVKQGKMKFITSAAWSPDGQQLALVGHDGAVQIWDTTNDTFLDILSAGIDKERNHSIAWRADGQQLAIAGLGCVKLWNSHNGTLQAFDHESFGHIYCVAWSPDQQRLAVAGIRKLLILSAISGESMAHMSANMYGIFKIAWSHDSQRLAATGGSTHIWDTASGKCLNTTRVSYSILNSVTWNPDGNEFALAGWGGIRIWDTVRHVRRKAIYGYFSSVAWSPEGRYLACLDWLDNSVKVFNSTSGLCEITLQGHEGSGTTVSWHADGQQLASAGGDNTIQIWHISTGACLLTLRGHESQISSVSWHSNGQLLASAGYDNTVRIWDIASESCLMTLTGHEDGVNAVAWRPENRQLASAGGDGTIRIWDTASEASILTLNGHDGGVNDIAWRYDGQQLATAGSDGLVRIWDAANGDCLFILKSIEWQVRSVAWGSDGRQLASIGNSGMACIWDATNGTLLYQCMIAGDAEVLLNDRDEVIQANDAAWPYLVRMGNNPETGEQMLIPAEVDEIGVVNRDSKANSKNPPTLTLPLLGRE
ncbi:MAG: NACHT domain-containing protein [Desulfuromonadaceae bacterium]|nr:NACHT domain-containing protein [Desulfuromonadaceae bacterium]